MLSTLINSGNDLVFWRNMTQLWRGETGGRAPGDGGRELP